ncbi:J domain-containing protein [Mycena chlorophos]|uniref:J domain-containing protein n=1 Tax=Mycena chlorophos TaxID=658473 RepID=A0A8H6SFG0_MYCCL|nr:J domain-containing protein [Mycena chlorophos]
MGIPILGIVGWAIVPHQATKHGLGILHRLLYNSFRIIPPKPGTLEYQRHYRYTFAVVVLGYLLYTLVQSSNGMQPNFYQFLGVGPSADDNTLKLAFRQFAKRFHPDRVGPQGEAHFILVRDAFEAVKNPTVRFAYDRFGPDVLTWKHCTTVGEYLRHGLMQSIGYHAVTLIILVFWTAVGETSPVAFWRYLLYFALFALEFSFLVSPSPPLTPSGLLLGPPGSEPSRRSLLHALFPQRVAYQHVLFLHQLFLFMSIALTRVAPQFFPDPSKVTEAMTHRLVQVASAVDREASQLLHTELHTIQPSAPQIPLSRLRPVANPAPEVMDLLSQEMEKMIIETSLKQEVGPLQSLWEAAIERGRAALAILSTPTPTPRKPTTSIFEFPRPLSPFRMSPAKFGGDGTAVLANGHAHAHPTGNGKVPGRMSPPPVPTDRPLPAVANATCQPSTSTVMNVFNPKILDASIRDVALHLSDNQKADLLIHALGNLSRDDAASRAVFENAIQSVLQVDALSAHNTARARILRAKRRLLSGYQRGAQEDLQAALAAEPDNPEAKALLHNRSVSVEKLLAPMPTKKPDFSPEIWREIALFLPRKDLKTLLFVPNMLSRVASQLLFRKLDLHLSIPPDHEEGTLLTYARRTADILSRVIVDPAFGGFVRTLRVYSYAVGRDDSMAFQIGMLSNALHKFTNLRNVAISALSENSIPLLRVFQHSSVRLRGLALVCPDAPVDLSTFECKTLHHISYSTREGNPSSVRSFISQNGALRTVSLHNMSWIFPSDALALRNLTSISFSGHFPANSTAFADILVNGRQLDSLSITCTLECLPAAQFRANPGCLPFLRHFGLTVCGATRKVGSSDLFPAVADFLRARSELRSVVLVVREEADQRTCGFDAAVWGVLPSLGRLRALTITYPRDLAASLAAWLVPRSVLALTLDHVSAPRDPISFLDQLRPGIPPSLRYAGLADFSSRSVRGIVEHGFPMVRVVRLGTSHWHVTRGIDGGIADVLPSPAKGPAALYEWLEWLGCEDAAATLDVSCRLCQLSFLRYSKPVALDRTPRAPKMVPVSNSAKNSETYFHTRKFVTPFKTQRSQWSLRQPFGFRSISVPQATIGYNHEGKIDQGITHLLVDGDATLFDSGAAVHVSYFRNDDVVDCVENRAMDALECLDWNTTLKILTQVEIRKGWTTNVTLKTRSDGSLELKPTMHKHHFVGEPLADVILPSIERISISAIRLLYDHECAWDVFKVQLLGDNSKEFIFKRGNLLEELKFFSPLPESKHLIRPTHAVVDESGCLRGMLLDHHPKGDLSFMYSSYRPTPNWLTIPSSEGDVPPPALTEEALFPPEVKLAWAYDIVDALEWLHERNIFWGDLTSQNVVLCDDGRCRLIDYFPDPGAWSPIFSPPELTPRGPRLEQDLAMTPARDVFNLGMTLWSVMEEISTFKREPEYVRPALPWRETTPGWFVDLVHSCIATDPAERPSASSVREVLLSHLA